MCVCVCACVRACVRACERVRACVRACLRVVLCFVFALNYVCDSISVNETDTTVSETAYVFTYFLFTCFC